MGCTSSKLAGEDFSDITATHRSPHPSTDPKRASTTSEVRMTSNPGFGSNAYMANLPFTGKSRKEVDEKLEQKRSRRESEQALLHQQVAQVQEREVGAVPRWTKSKDAPFVDRADQLDAPVTRTDEDRVARGVAANGGKKLGLYQRYTNSRLGKGEERDPVTGRGKYTGMTKEETIAYVERTRGMGMMSGRQYNIGGPGGSGLGAVAC